MNWETDRSKIIHVLYKQYGTFIFLRQMQGEARRASDQQQLDKGQDASQG
jgi:hypothetical protein